MSYSRGFSLVELIVTIGVAAVLLAFATPSILSSITNAKIRATAQSFQSGLQRARSEAISRNAQIQFALVTDLLPQASSAASTTGKGWVVRTVEATPVLIEGKAPQESGKNSIVVNDADGDGAPDANALSLVTFNGLGGTSLGANAVFTFATIPPSNPNNHARCAPAGVLRCLNVTVSIGGQIRICDPAVNDAEDTRRCL